MLLILALVSLGIIALLLYFIYRNKETANKILNDRNNQLDLLNQKLGIANNTKAKLFGIIGHDLRSPISQVVQLLQMRKGEGNLLTDEARLTYENKIQEASEHVLETMEDLLLWSKSQMQQFTPQFKNVNIVAVLERELAGSAQLLKNKSISIHVDIGSGFVQNTDENFATVVIRNLLQNAIKYCDRNSGIDITGQRETLQISNQCSGISADTLNDMLNSNAVNSQSSGLGLQIVHDLAAVIGIKIQFLQQDRDRIVSVISWTV